MLISFTTKNKAYFRDSGYLDNCFNFCLYLETLYIRDKTLLTTAYIDLSTKCVLMVISILVKGTEFTEPSLAQSFYPIHTFHKDIWIKSLNYLLKI